MTARHRLFSVSLFLCTAFAMIAAEPPRHVVVLVWDGMRPDFISAEQTPNLWRLAQRGAFFAHHHPVFLSETEVNGTAIATGTYPGHSTVIANTDYRPRIDPVHSIGIEIPANVRKGDAVSGGHYLARPTVAEILRAHGFQTAIAGSKQVALLHDRALRSEGSPIVFEGAAMPDSLQPELARDFGRFPRIGADEDKIDRDAWTTRVLTQGLWKSGVPTFSLLWLAEPDASQHASGPGSVQALRAIASSDHNLGLVVAELERRGVLASTDVFVASDHGFSTIGRKIDVAAELSRAGFDAVRKTNGTLQPGQIIAVGNGGSSLLYVGNHDPAVVHRLVSFLQTQDWTGAILSRDALPGTFPLTATHDDSPDAPDVIATLHWTREKSVTGAPGMIDCDLAPTVKKVGNHASLGAYDMHNTLVAAGPDIRTGVTTTLPSANTDLAPTILWCLGLHDEAKQMDGRVLSEALTIQGPPLKSYDVRQLTAENGPWHQYLNVSEVNGVRYLDEGNGSPAQPDETLKR